jgi:hypothetical protein
VITGACSVRCEWTVDELIECWTLLDDDRRLPRSKTGASWLAFTLLRTLFELTARSTWHSGEILKAGVVHVAEQLDVDAEALAGYGWSSPQTKRRRMELREVLGCWPVADPESAARLTDGVSRGLPGPFWTRVKLCGRFCLDMTSHLHALEPLLPMAAID